ESLSLVHAAQTSEKSAVPNVCMLDIVEALKQDYDYIVIGCHAGNEQGLQNAIAGADHAIIVTTPEHSSVRHDDRIIGWIEQDEIERSRIVSKRIRNHMMEEGEMLSIDDILQVLSIDLLGIVIDSDRVIKASNSGEPIAMSTDNKASIAYRNIARRILGETVPLQSLEETKGLFQKVKSFFSKRS